MRIKALINYYQIDVYDRESEDYCVIERPPKEIHLLSSYIMDGTSAIHKYPANVVALMSDKYIGRVCTDFIANRELSLIVSERVKQVIETHCQDGTEYLPVSIKNHKGRIEKEQFYYINPVGAEDLLNYQASNIKWSDDQKVIKVKTFVFDRTKLNAMPKHLFRVKEWPTKYFVSETLIEAIQQIPTLTNLHLVEIRIVENKTTVD